MSVDSLVVFSAFQDRLSLCRNSIVLNSWCEKVNRNFVANLQVIRDAIELDLILEHGLVFNCNSDDSIALSGRIFCCEINNELRFSCACSYLDIAHC